jgi:hypothetical protein
MEARQRPWSSADFSKGAAMGFLGIMRDPRGVAFQLPELNVNLWVLPGLFGRRVVYLDVGIHLRAPSESALSSFVLLLPGGTGEEVVDLATSLTDPKVAKLIFGEQVEIDVNEGRLCFVEGEDVEILPISKTETSKVAAKSDSNFSHWHIQLARTVRETAYVRLRFRVRTRGRMLLIRGFGMFASRILIDFRVSDLRESVTVPDQAIYQQALLPIEKLTCHAILPTRFRAPPVGASTLVLPPRLLEGTVWESYLGRATYLLRQGKLTVFPWHHDDRITLNRPFRAFIDVARDTPVLLPYQFLLAVVAVACAELLVLDPSLLEGGLAVRAATAAAHAAWALLAAAGIGSMVGFVVWLLGRRGKLRALTERAESIISAIEDRLYWLRMARRG